MQQISKTHLFPNFLTIYVRHIIVGAWYHMARSFGLVKKTLDLFDPVLTL